MTSPIESVEILLVEDNPTDAELATLALKERGLANNLVWVKDGAEALDFFFATGAYANRQIENTPKVVLLDLRLPKVDGLEVLRRIKADDRTKNIPVAVLTSSKEGRDVIASYQLGVNSYISKPVDFDE
ncbi:MAG: response regulator receiver, partial [Comamonadaceae bacterium]